MILPTGASSFSEAMAMGCEVYHHLAKVRALFCFIIGVSTYYTIKAFDMSQ